jgi:hypothetical protein
LLIKDKKQVRKSNRQTSEKTTDVDRWSSSKKNRKKKLYEKQKGQPMRLERLLNC